MGQYKITDSNIISFEMSVKLNYKNCEITFKKTDQVHIITAIDITEKGYIVEYSETFLEKKKICPNLSNFFNNVVDKELKIVYQKLIAKKKFTDKIRNN